MPEFKYIALSGAGKEVKGVLTAESTELARNELRHMELTPISISEQSLLSKDIQIRLLDAKPKVRDLSVFCRQFTSIIDAGVPVVSALEMLTNQTENKKLAHAIADTRLSVEKGETLAASLGKHVDIFGPMFISLIAAGEASGSLSTSLSRMAEQYEKDAKIRSSIKKATIYPMVMLLVTIIVIIVMLIVVIPTFEEMFMEMGTELPALTVAVVTASEFMQQYWYLVIGLMVGFVIFVRFFSKSDIGSRAFSRIALRLPIFGRHLIKANSARLTRTLATLIASGIPLLEALEITANTITNTVLKDAVLEARDDAAMGGSMSDSLRRSGVFPPLVYQMLSIGEESGDSEGMLTNIANYYDEEVETSTSALMAMLEPMIIIIMAGLIGTIIMAVMLPLAEMYSALDSL